MGQNDRLIAGWQPHGNDQPEDKINLLANSF